MIKRSHDHDDNDDANDYMGAVQKRYIMLKMEEMRNIVTRVTAK